MDRDMRTVLFAAIAACIFSSLPVPARNCWQVDDTILVLKGREVFWDESSAITCLCF